jgi:hypothetical protein
LVRYLSAERCRAHPGAVSPLVYENMREDGCRKTEYFRLYAWRTSTERQAGFGPISSRTGDRARLSCWTFRHGTAGQGRRDLNAYGVKLSSLGVGDIDAAEGARGSKRTRAYVGVPDDIAAGATARGSGGQIRGRWRTKDSIERRFGFECCASSTSF